MLISDLREHNTSRMYSVLAVYSKKSWKYKPEQWISIAAKSGQSF